MAINIGFTGSRNGLTNPQRRELSTLLRDKLWMELVEVAHGDCVGGDEQFHDLVIKLDYKTYIHVFPPVNEELRAFCRGNKIYGPMPYLGRNAEIVARSKLIIACPSSMSPNLRSGTWWTYELATKRNKPTILILPDGKVIRS